MYRAIAELTLDGTRYAPGQVVDVQAIDARTVARLVEQRRLIVAVPPVNPGCQLPEPAKRKSA